MPGCRAARRSSEHRLPARGHARPDEQRRLDALAADADDAEHHDRGRGSGERGGELGLQLALEMTGVPRHPEDHPGDEADGDDREAAAERLLRLRGESVRAEGEQGADAERDDDRGGDPDPQLRQDVAAVDLVEIGDQDADDEAGFEAFTQTDQERSRARDAFGREWKGSGSRFGEACLTYPTLTQP